jgi:kumamolisin
MQSRLASIVAGKEIPHLSKEEFAREHGADPSDFAKVRTFAEAHGLKVLQEHAARRTVILSGTVAQFSPPSACSCIRCLMPAAPTADARAESTCPPSGTAWSRPSWGSTTARRPGLAFEAGTAPGNIHRRPAAAVSYTPPQVAAFYGYPNARGAGQCIALIELGGGYRPTDLSTYFSGLDVSAPSVTAVSVDHATNSPTGDADGPDGEVMLDIEVAGSIAPEARIAVYFSPNTDAGFLDAITTAIHDTTQQSLGHLHQLGRSGIDLDLAVHDRHGRGVPGGRPPWASPCASRPATAAHPTA